MLLNRAAYRTKKKTPRKHKANLYCLLAHGHEQAVQGVAVARPTRRHGRAVLDCLAWGLGRPRSPDRSPAPSALKFNVPLPLVKTDHAVELLHVDQDGIATKLLTPHRVSSASYTDKFSLTLGVMEGVLNVIERLRLDGVVDTS